MQVAGWIIGGADNFDMTAPNQRARRKLRGSQFGVGEIPDLFGGVTTQYQITAEETAQFEMGPFKHRVAPSIFHGFAPGDKLLVVIAIASDEFFRDTISPFQAPLVVIAVCAFV